MNKQGHILVVDDSRTIRLKLSYGLLQQGHTIVEAENGAEALEKMREEAFDLVLLDIIMPGMDGYQVLERMKSDRKLRDIPVIVISALEEMDSAIRCIKMGAEDHLPKEFKQELLTARIGACLEKKWLRDQEQAFLKQIQIEREKSERLLLNILPEPIAERLKQGQDIIADSFAAVTVLFADIVSFTKLSSVIEPTALVVKLNEVFSVFDELAREHALEKIKTIGDAYMLVGGLPTPRPDHAEAIAEMALDMQKGIAEFNRTHNDSLHIRIGINTGPVVAGVIGTTKFSYDLWGDTVNIASRMESQGIPDQIQVTADTYALLQDKYVFKERGIIEVKGKGKMLAYLLVGRK